MKRFVMILVLTCVLVLGYGEDEKQREPRHLDLSKFSVSSDIPTSWMLAHTPYNSNEIIHERTDLPETIRDRERKYTWRWICKMIEYRFMIRMHWELNKDDIFFISGLGNNNDDAAILLWEIDSYKFELIDSRILTLLVEKKGLWEMDTLEVFEKIIPFGGHGDKRFITNTIQDKHILYNDIYYGKILVFPPSYINGGWFTEPVEWYRDGDCILFAFKKILKPYWDKGGYDGDYKNNIGGIPVDDPRSFLRFENTNREQLSEEYGPQIFTDEKKQKLYPREIEFQKKKRVWGLPYKQ